MHARLDAIDPIEHRLRQCHRRQATGANQRRSLGDGDVGEIDCVSHAGRPRPWRLRLSGWDSRGSDRAGEEVAT